MRSLRKDSTSSLVITSIVILRSVHVVRTCDVAVTKDVIKVVEGYKKYIMK